MNWGWAKHMLRDGRKITRPNWEEGHFWVMSKDGFERILCHDGTNASVHIKQTEADNWELFEEKKSLSDKVVFACQGCIGNIDSPKEGWHTKIIFMGDVRESIKKLKKQFDDWEIDDEVQHRVLNKIFGKTLC